VGAVEGTPSLASISLAHETDISVREMLTICRLLLIHLGDAELYTWWSLFRSSRRGDGLLSSERKTEEAAS